MLDRMPVGRVVKQAFEIGATRSAPRKVSPICANGTPASSTFIRLTSPTRIKEGICGSPAAPLL